MTRKLSITMLLLLTAVVGYAQDKSAVFVFKPGDAMFYGREVEGNSEKLDELNTYLNHHLVYVDHGQVRVNVTAYSTSAGSVRANKNLSFERANRVKSELITHCGLREEMFYTLNKAEKYEAQGDVVVVEVHLAQISDPVAEQPQPVVVIENKEFEVSDPVDYTNVAPSIAPEPKPEPVAKEEPAPAPQPEPVVAMEAPKGDHYKFALRTNLLYDAMLVPNLGIEWRASQRIGVKVDAGGSNWGKPEGNIQKMWYVNPEVRYYMGTNKRLYAGVGGNVGAANIYGYPMGKVLDVLARKERGFQGTMWNAGAVVGYQLRLSNAFSLDLNIGAGYNNFEYDSFTLQNETRIYKDRDQTKSSFGITQAGVSLVWKICK